MRIKWFFFLKNIFHPKYEAFLAESQKTLNVGKIRNYDEERVFFREEKGFIFLKAVSTKTRRAKYADGIRTFCFESL